MIIKNNYNKNDVNPLTDYDSIGKGSHSLEKDLDNERKGFIRKNMDNKVLEDIRTNRDDTEDPHDDNWKLFR